MSAYDDLVALDGAVAHWPLDELAGTVAHDITAHGHDGTLKGSPTLGLPGPVTGQSAMGFTGGAGGSYVLLAEPASLPTPQGALSWEAWVNFGSTSGGGDILTVAIPHLPTGLGALWEYDFTNNGPPRGYVLEMVAGGNRVELAGGVSFDTSGVTDGRWHHCVFTLDASGAQTLYLDGVPVILSTSAPLTGSFTPLYAAIAGNVLALDPTTTPADDRAVPSYDGSLAHVAVYPLALSACQALSHYDLATTGTYTPCVDWLRLAHASGRSYIQQNGEQVQMVAGGAGVLDLPLPMLPAAPHTLVGKDAATGLPAFCPAPIPTTATVVLGGGGGSQPAPAPVCVQVRCGVSGACRDHLVSLYQDWSHWLDPLFQAAATLGVAAAIVSIPWDWTVDLELGMVIKSGIISLLHDFGSAITGNLLPVLDVDLQNDIQRALFDQLTCVNDQVQVSADNVAAWKAALDALTTWPIASLAGPFCSLLLQYTPLARWQAAASTASPSTACDAWP